jgi:SEL1 protein
MHAAQYTAGNYEEAVLAYLRGAEMGLEVAQSNAAWMLSRAYGAAGPAATALAQLLHQRAAGQARAHASCCCCCSCCHAMPTNFGIVT